VIYITTPVIPSYFLAFTVIPSYFLAFSVIPTPCLKFFYHSTVLMIGVIVIVESKFGWC